MTLAQLLTYYANLLILQYRGKTKARESIKTLVTMPIMDQLPLLVQDGFDLTTAAGVQLDVLGQYQGVTRYGFDFSGAVTLTDTQFRTLINLMIEFNRGVGTLDQIQTWISTYFPGKLLVFDHTNMHIDYFFTTTIGSDQLLEFFIEMVGLPKPMGVQLGTTTYVPGVNNFFGFQTYKFQGYTNHGFNLYSAYDPNCPFLEYTDAL